MNRHAALAAISLLTVSAAQATTFSKSVDQPASIFLKETAEGCRNNPGPFITLTGELKLGGINARLILTNNAKFTHVTEADITVEAVLLPAGESIQIAKQPSRGGVGGNPYIWLQFNDCKGGPLTPAPTFLGRCVQGLKDSSLNFSLPTDVTIDTSAGSCSNHPGPFITLEGELSLGGLCATLVFTNNAKFTHVTSADITVDVVLLAEGETIRFAKQPPEGGVGGNPFIWVQFLDGSGAEVGTPFLVGRCNQLGE